MLSNCSNDIYNHVAFLHKRSRVNSISLSFFVLLLTLSVLALHFRPNWKRCQLVRNFLGKFPKNPLNCLNSEMKTISPKLLGILAVKSNRIRIPSRNVFKKKNLGKVHFSGNSGICCSVCHIMSKRKFRLENSQKPKVYLISPLIITLRCQHFLKCMCRR